MIFFGIDEYEREQPENAEVIQKAVKVLDWIFELEEKPEVRFFIELEDRLDYAREGRKYGYIQGWKRIKYDDLHRAKSKGDRYTAGYTFMIKDGGMLSDIWINVTENKHITSNLNKIVEALAHEYFHRWQLENPGLSPDKEEKPLEFEQQANDFGGSFTIRFNHCLHTGQLNELESCDNTKEFLNQLDPLKQFKKMVWEG